jgi:23S rRNA (cytidine1920-2'-O)/16S rRNA (cytidine1409-2'-O)-methyltransferase
MEETNARFVDSLPEEVSLATVDASFISLKILLPVIRNWMMGNGQLVCLIKPQFEVGKGEVGKGGVVRDKALHEKVIDQISKFSRGLGLKVLGVTESPLLGPKGNKEFFIYLRKENERDGQTEGTRTG